ncbi:MAG: hypothetical protein M3347_10950, partial [Armatimonadota bacterium]|nr:hypothetical protein [Armatimonadota bacterium]
MSFSFGIPTPLNVVMDVAINLLLHSSLLLLLGLVTAHALRRRGPVLQALIYRTTLVGVVLTAVFSTLFSQRLTPVWNIPLNGNEGMAQSSPSRPTVPRAAPPPTSPVSSRAPLLAPSTPDHDSAISTRVPLTSSGETSPHPSPAPPPMQRANQIANIEMMAVRLWMAGAGLLLAWLCLCYLRIAGVCRQSVVIRDGQTFA